jgi:uncharacterized membrane protein YqaE (UPF0057 family)
MYLIAILCPPLAVLIVGKTGQAFLNLILSLCLYFPGLIHALCVVGESKAEARNARLIAAMQGPQAAPDYWDRTAIYGNKPATEIDNWNGPRDSEPVSSKLSERIFKD